jgi:hypothetical protein
MADSRQTNSSRQQIDYQPDSSADFSCSPTTATERVVTYDLNM